MTDLALQTRNEPDDDDLDNIDDLEAVTGAVEELRSSVEKHQKDTDEKLEKRMAEITDSVKKLEVRVNRPGSKRTESEGDENEIEKRAFGRYLQRGDASLTDIETRNLTTATNGGGYLAPQVFANEIIKGLVEWSPIRQYARVMTISAGEVQMPKRSGTMTAAWVTETGNRPSTDPTYTQESLTPHEAACYVDVSNALLEDNAYNLQGEITADASEEFGRLEGASFVDGTGSGQPEGLWTASGIGETVTGAAAALDNADALINLFYALPTFYSRNGVWLMNRLTMGAIRKLKDGDDNYIWKEGIAEGQPATLLGRPVVEAPDAPDIAANAYPVMFGDLRQAYRIVDRVQLAALRDPFTRATNGQTRFHFRRRTGAKVLKAEAIKKLKVSA